MPCYPSPARWLLREGEASLAAAVPRCLPALYGSLSLLPVVHSHLLACSHVTCKFTVLWSQVLRICSIVHLGCMSA